MVVITLRVSNLLREKMKEHPEINWSEVVREAIAKRIELEERQEAVKSIEEVRGKMKPVEKGQMNQWIREDRQR